MLCPECGRYNEDDKVVCQYCGKLLEREMPDAGEEELMRFRQGRHLRGKEPLPPEPTPRRRRSSSRAFEDPQPPETPESTGEIYGQRESLQNTGRFYGDPEELPLETEDPDDPMTTRFAGVQESQYQRKSRVKRHLSYRRMVNWAHMAIIAVVLLIVGAVGFLVFLRNTESGQVIVARWGYDASAAALWTVGNEHFENGEVDLALECFVSARMKDEEAKALTAPNLLQMGEAYEAQGNLEAASEVYACIYTDVEPTSSDAYNAHVRVLKELGREAEAAVLLQTAYQKTGLPTFRTERLALLPALPTVSVVGGYYNKKQTVELHQSQEHSIYYTFDIYAELPGEGILYEGPIELGEGEHELRAVAVNGDLVSDPMKTVYQIYMPTPLQPDANLAPGTYTSARKNVKLWPGKLSDEQLEKNPGYAETLDDPVAQTITIYYTIDGSIPDADSPIYTGEPIVMATSGYMTLRAVSVNGYGKQGNMKEIEIKLNLKGSTPKVYNVQDVIGKLKIAATTQESFLSEYGEGKGKESVWLSGIEGECARYTYDWGYVTFMKQTGGWLLAEVYLTSNALAAPRGTSIGMTEEQITSKFKDFGQVTSPSGNRGLYRDLDNSDEGKIFVQPDGGKIIRYRTDTPDVHVWQLEYILNDKGVVTAIHWIYER